MVQGLETRSTSIKLNPKAFRKKYQEKTSICKFLSTFESLQSPNQGSPFPGFAKKGKLFLKKMENKGQQFSSGNGLGHVNMYCINLT